uniref:TonB-dependent receptor n=1 Tax=Alistipes megaguti TaxID=2364787 RepID=UPI0018D5868B|nr:TonB-dependent receptor [Alistipes megaguti]
MKLKALLFLMLAAVSFVSYAQQGGVRGTVVSRNGRVALSNVEVKIESLGLTATTDNDGRFQFESLPAGSYRVQFTTPDFEPLELLVRVGTDHVQDLKQVILVPGNPSYGGFLDDAVFAEFDSDSSSSDSQALPSSLSASKDLFNNIASYRFSEMRFNVRGYDSQFSDIYLNGIRFNDALTGYGPWSLWSGLNDATRNQENHTGLEMADFGIGGIGGLTNINARASQFRKGFRVSVSNANQMYRFRAMISYGSGQLDNGWSYAFSLSTRQGGNGYVDGVYYNSYAYFASVEKLFGDNHRLALTFLASPTERGAQQASTDEAYALFGNNYYNPNVGYQAGKLRNSRVRNTHEPIAMLNYTWDISENTRLNAATSLRFGKNGYSALTWNGGSDPRGDYYRYMPLSDMTQYVPGTTTDQTYYYYLQSAVQGAQVWDGMLKFDDFYHMNQYVDTELTDLMGDSRRSNYMIEERHTDQLDYNLAVNVQHNMRNNMKIVGGANLRVNRTNYYSQVKDLLGGDYWYDIDKFAERDMASETAYQNDLDYYWSTGHARIAREGDMYGYYYRAHLLESEAWANYSWAVGGFSLGVAGSVGYSQMYREGMWRKGLFPDNSKGDSKKLDYLTYEGKLSLGYKFSGAHSLEANAVILQQAPKFNTAFVSPRTRNNVTPGLKAEKVFGVDLTYNLNLPYIKARLSGYYTTIADQAKVISFYDDTRSSFTNFAMSGIDKRHYGVELGLSIPVWNGISVVGALSWGDYTYTSNADFVQTVDNVDRIVLRDKVNWKGMHVESSPQTAINVGLDYRGARNWFAGVNLNYYDRLYLSMNPFYRTNTASEYFTNLILSELSMPEPNMTTIDGALSSINELRAQEEFGGYFTLSANVGKNWYIGRYMLGMSLEVKNILNDQDIRTGGYEQMRMSKVRAANTGDYVFGRFPSKYFYMLGTTYFLNVYLRF